MNALELNQLFRGISRNVPTGWYETRSGTVPDSVPGLFRWAKSNCL